MSVGELAMTPKISLVAVCCSNDSLSSLNSRTFSMAITAWSAKVSSSLICRSVNGRTSVRRIAIAPISCLSTQRGTATLVRVPFAGRTRVRWLAGRKRPECERRRAHALGAENFRLGGRSLCRYWRRCTRAKCSPKQPPQTSPSNLEHRTVLSLRTVVPRCRRSYREPAAHR